MRVHDSLQVIVRSIVYKSDCDKWLDPEDLFQETMTRAFQKGQGLHFNNEAALLSWLAKVAKSSLINLGMARAAQKRGNGKQAIALERAARSISQDFFASGQSPSRAMRRREVLDAVRLALVSLPAEYQIAIEFRYGSELSIRETAAKMGRREGAVKMVINRALVKIRKSLEAAGFSSAGSVTL